MEEIENINKRIRFLMKKELDLKAAEFGEEIGVSGQTAYNLTKPSTTINPSWDVLNKILSRYDGEREGESKISAEWLMRGAGDIWLDDDVGYPKESKAVKLLEDERVMYRRIIKNRIPDVADILNIQDHEG